ncbi:MAG: hypothetical protein U0Y82_02210 [Thermoleophilia bacterium]
MSDREFNPNELQKALLGYDPSDLEKSLIGWMKEHWAQAARGMVYHRKEAEDTVSGLGNVRSDEGRLVMEIAARVAISERELVARAIAANLPDWLERTYGLKPKGLDS